jgi:hypothetical protein
LTFAWLERSWVAGFAKEAGGRVGCWHCVLLAPTHDLERGDGLIVVSSIARGTLARPGFPSLHTPRPGTWLSGVPFSGHMIMHGIMTPIPVEACLTLRGFLPLHCWFIIEDVDILYFSRG